MSYQIVIEADAEQDIDAATAWFTQYDPAKAVVWHFDVIIAFRLFRYVARLRLRAKPLMRRFDICYFSAIAFFFW